MRRDGTQMASIQVTISLGEAVHLCATAEQQASKLNDWTIFNAFGPLRSWVREFSEETQHQAFIEHIGR